MSSARDRERAAKIAEVLAFAGRHRVSLDDLVNVGGEDLKASNAARAEKARRVDKTWSLMARLGINIRVRPSLDNVATGCFQKLLKTQKKTALPPQKLTH
jgi:hypothetical protein